MSYRVDMDRGVVVLEAEVPIAEFLRLVLRDDVAALLGAPVQASAAEEACEEEAPAPRKRAPKKAQASAFTEDYVKEFIAENGPCGVNAIAKSLGRRNASAQHYALIKFLVEDGQLVKNGDGTHVTYALAEES